MTDIIIIGAGPAGLSCACSLSALGLKVIVVEKNTEKSLASPKYDGREIALTHHSKTLMEDMGVWNRIPDNVISLVKEAKVLDGNSNYALHFDYREVCNDTLGYIISNDQIRKALYEEVKTRKEVQLVCSHSVENIYSDETTASVSLSNEKSIQASLIVAADSRFSVSRRKMGISTSIHDFGNVAIVCKVRHELPHENIAYECFRYGKTLAVLPLPNNESSIVITVSTEKASDVLNQSPKLFNADVTELFNHRFGDMELIGERYSYPLVATYADRFAAKRFAVIGDAAIGMHPVTAHGFNFGIKGQNILANYIKQALIKGRDIAADSVLTGYSNQHRLASKPLYTATNMIVKLYTNDHFVPRVLRKALLHLGNNISPVKKTIMKQLIKLY